MFESAVEAVRQKNFEQAVALYREAGEYFEQVSYMKNCRCPKISKNADHNAKLSRERADKYQAHAKELKCYDEYNKARAIYREADAHCKNREWDQAIAALEEAAQIWDSVGAATQSENGKKAIGMAEKCRKAISDIRQLQQQ